MGITSLPSANSGVLTKADLVQEGEHEHWLKIINNKSHILHHGYYMTRLPANPTETLQNADARPKEARYFAGHQHWKTADRNRLGIPKLTDALSTRLSIMIEETFPPLYPHKANLQAPRVEKKSLRETQDCSPRVKHPSKVIRGQPASKSIVAMFCIS